MKKDLHPKFKRIKTKCVSCEKEFEISSVSDKIKIDICSSCHPFYTGKQTSGQKAGRIEQFNKKFNKK